MKKDVVEVQIKGVMPTTNGCALFLGNEEKTFVIYIDHGIGTAISMAINGVQKERPLTHDLMHNIFQGLGVKMKRVIINDAREGTYFARMILHMKNEVGTKILEVDARPSDSIAMAVHQEAPIFVDDKVFAEAEDMTEVLEKILSQNEGEEGDEEETD